MFISRGVYSSNMASQNWGEGKKKRVEAEEEKGEEGKKKREGEEKGNNAMP